MVSTQHFKGCRLPKDWKAFWPRTGTTLTMTINDMPMQLQGKRLMVITSFAVSDTMSVLSRMPSVNCGDGSKANKVWYIFWRWNSSNNVKHQIEAVDHRICFSAWYNAHIYHTRWTILLTHFKGQDSQPHWKCFIYSKITSWKSRCYGNRCARKRQEWSNGQHGCTVAEAMNWEMCSIPSFTTDFQCDLEQAAQGKIFKSVRWVRRLNYISRSDLTSSKVFSCLTPIAPAPPSS